MAAEARQQQAPVEGAPLAEHDYSPDLEAALAASFSSARGDASGLSTSEREAHYLRLCRALRLNPLTQPLQWLKLNGKEILYVGRGATDQLAAMHRVTRETIDGPKVMDIGGTKVAVCVVKATLPSGRSETAYATLPVTDPVNLFMKLETKAKRRATLSLLGLGMLDETELETIPAAVKVGTDEPWEPITDSPALAEFFARVAEVELPGEGVAVWIRHRNDLAQLHAAEREAAWKALCKRTEKVGRMKQARVWLKKAIAEEDLRRANAGEAPVPPQAPPAPVTWPERFAQANGRLATPELAAEVLASDDPAALPAYVAALAARVRGCTALAGLDRAARGLARLPDAVSHHPALLAAIDARRAELAPPREPGAEG